MRSAGCLTGRSAGCQAVRLLGRSPLGQSDEKKDKRCSLLSKVCCYFNVSTCTPPEVTTTTSAGVRASPHNLRDYQTSSEGWVYDDSIAFLLLIPPAGEAWRAG